MANSGRRRGKYSQAVRVIKMLDRLRGRRFGCSLADLAEEFNISERQVRRDLEVLTESGYALKSVTISEKSGIALMQAAPSSLRLSVRERFTLLATRRVFDILKHTPLYEDIQSIYEKIVSSLPSSQQADLENFGDRFVFLPDHGTKIYRDKDDILDALLTGVIRRWKVKYRYRPHRGRAREGQLAPYALVLYKNGLYVIGKRADSDPKDTPHVYAAERFLDAEHIRASSFELPSNFSVDQFFSGAFGIHHGNASHRVIIDFSADARNLIKSRVWHENQKITSADGNKVRLSFDVSDLTQVVSWVLSWGPMAKVIGPDELKEKVYQELDDATKMYR